MRYSSILILLIAGSLFGTAQDLEWTDQELVEIIDTTVINNMTNYQIPGVGYALVKGGKVIHLGSHGLADIDKQSQVSADTPFMMGSVSKTFTALAVLQLFDEGKIELDADVNNYLKSIQLPYRVTLRQLLTHTGGLEESLFERVKLSPDDFILLGDYLKQHIPRQIFIPGKYPAYSNHGMAIAGLVVQEVSGFRFEDYVQQRIFTPLGMIHSSFYLDDNALKSLATPYLLKNGTSIATLPEYVQTIPASMLISTTSDMAKFLVYLLNESESRILKPETLHYMKSKQYSPHPKLWGRTFGFFERNYRGKAMLEHGGSRNGFYSQLSLLPQDSIGIFITYNGGKSDFRNEVIFNFLGNIYPEEKRIKIFNNDKINISEYEGTYISNRRIESNFGKLLTQLSFVEKIKVQAVDERTLSLFGYEYQPESTDQFDISNDSTVSFPVAFGRNNDEKISVLFLPGRSDSYQKMKCYESGLTAAISFISATLLFLSLIVIGIKNIIKGRFQFHPKEGKHTLPVYRFIYSIINFIFLGMLIGVLLVSGESLQYELPIVLFLIFSLPIVGLFLLLLLIYQFAKFWHVYSWSIRALNCSLILIFLLYSWQLYSWNFIGFNF